jgi:hypothetical protein
MAAFYALKSKPSITTSAPKILGVIKPVKIFRGASLAHRKLAPDQAAKGAADWLDGEAFYFPTMTDACRKFGTYYSAVVAARGKRGNRPNPSMWLGILARAWVNCDEEQRAAFARAFEPGLWKALERVIDVQSD